MADSSKHENASRGRAVKKSVYPSSVGTFLAAVLIAAALALVVFGAITLARSIAAGVIEIGVGVMVGGLIAAFSIPCVYRITDKSLTIQCGLLEDDLPLDRIKRVEKSASWWSGPALSLRRVKITLEDGYRLISPRDRDAFIADLTARLARRNTAA